MAKKPYIKLRRLMEDQGLNQGELSALTGINYNTLGKHLNDRGDWLFSEITAICRVLHIPQDKIGEYFFPRVEKGETA